MPDRALTSPCRAAAVGAVLAAACFGAEPSIFERAANALAIVSAGAGSGSGFVLLMDGKRYLVSNEHVFRGGTPVSAVLLDGRKLAFAGFELAEDRDLARLEITGPPETAALAPSAKTPEMEMPVSIFGNSGGAGVATELKGRILGIGPLLLETDAPFVSGNSGSPVMDSDGNVVAVATFAVRSAAPGDWLSEGTRFAQVRRFGVRLQNTKWKKVPFDQYVGRVEALADMETFCSDLYALRFTENFLNPRTGLLEYTYEKESKRYRRSVRLCRLLADVAETCNSTLVHLYSAQSHAAQADALAENRGIAKARPEINEHERRFTINRMLAEAKYKEHVAAWKKLHTDVSNFLRATDWFTQQLKEEAEQWQKVLTLLTQELPE